MAPDLSPNGSPKGRQVYTVTEFNRAVRSTLETEFSTLWIEGEISNLRIPSSGHCYLTLKDDQSQIRAVFFKNSLRLLKFKPVDGMKVILRGRVSVYEQKGEYQLIADLLEPKGKGSLQEAFEQLKKKLAEEGLFDPKFKKPIPPYPNRIVLVTSPTGAAIRDLIRIITRRYDSVRILLIPVRVQGEGAAQEIAAALALANRIPDADVIIAGRGGGSLEDLWAFNEEIVARAIFDSRIPVVSAVGHETDFTIADFVADLRASTPSAAAELVVPEKEGLVRFVQDCRRRLVRTIRGRIEEDRDRLENVLARKAFGSPYSMVGPHLVRLDDLRERAVRAVNRQTKGQKQEIARLHKQVRQLNPVLRVKRIRILLSERDKKLVAAGRAKSRVLRTRAEGLLGRFLTRAPKDRTRRGWERLLAREVLLRERATERMKGWRDAVQAFYGKLNALSPLAVLSRGFSISRLAGNGTILKDASRLQEGDRVEVILHRGGFRGSVSEVLQPGREGD